MYLPIFNKGAQFFTGTATPYKGTEKSTAGRLRFHSRQRCNSSYIKAKVSNPRVETATDYLTTGLSVDLNEATRIALQEAIDFLQEKGMTAADAYALSSLAVDLGIGEAVDVVNLVYAKIPKSIFKSNPAIGGRSPGIKIVQLEICDLGGG